MEERLDITGQVIDTRINTGVSGLRVEVWDKSLRFQQAITVLKTGEDGRFNTSIELKKYDFERPPEVFFKVYKDENLLTSVENVNVWNANTENDVTLFINSSTREERSGKDHITTMQVLKMADFFQQSDFDGAYKEVQNSAGISLNFLTDMIMNSIKDVDIKPVKPRQSIVSEVYNQDVDATKRSLAAQKIAVNEVLPYQPKLNSESFKTLRTGIVKLKPGQKVNLYEENGKVKYYSIIKDDNQIQADVQLPNSDLIKLKEELTLTRQEAAAKDAQINQLKSEIELMKNDQLEIKKVINSDLLSRILKEQKKEEDTGPK